MDGKQGNLLRDPEIIARAQKDNSVLEQLIPEGVKLVGFCYWRYFGGDRRIQRTFMQREDLLQDGLLGFLEAVKRFDPSRGVMFSTFAVPYILGHMNRKMRDYGAPFYVPRSVMEKSIHVIKARDALRQVLGRSPTFDELQEETGLPYSAVIDAFRAFLVESLQEVACGKEDGDDNRPLEAMFGESSGWEDEIIDKVDWESSVGHLHPHMAQVVKLRSEGLTQREIANVLGCSQGNVSRMEAILRREWGK